MERFIFVAAITFAIIFAVVATVGHGLHGLHGVHFEVGDSTDPVMPTEAGAMAAQTFAGDQLEVRHAAVRLNIVAEDRQDFSIEINNPGHLPMPSVSVDDGRVLVDGHLSNRIERCTETGAETRGYGELSFEQMPEVIVHAPRALRLGLGSAGRAEIGPSASLDLDMNGCGAAVAQDITGELKVSLAGSGQVHTGAAHSLDADVAGSGDIVTGAIADDAHIDIGGSGTTTIAALTGELHASSAGSGDVAVNGGAIPLADIDLAGSGGVTVAAPIQSLKASIVGSGDVRVNAPVHDVDVSIAGSGGVRAASITGAVHKRVMGSGDVTTGP
jgi:hypothetical protein